MRQKRSLGHRHILELGELSMTLQFEQTITVWLKSGICFCKNNIYAFIIELQKEQCVHIQSVFNLMSTADWLIADNYIVVGDCANML